ncbi:hypothetical protein scyTo_0025143 [Scyliorhinus torazame]|uniref:CCHC-type domain-containing protein n=1 Tax=Scyliorhinus torazame TaxID=75743 RepID=A0A401QGQ7_SCYTO|nr:hypothetical protein [Scyliorhinus torazame]
MVTKYVKGKLPYRTALAQLIMGAEEPLDEAEQWTRDQGRRWPQRKNAKAVWLFAYQRQAQNDKRAKVRMREALEEQARKAGDREAVVSRLELALAGARGRERALEEQAGNWGAEVDRLMRQLAEGERALEEQARKTSDRKAEFNRSMQLAEGKRALEEQARKAHDAEAEVNRLMRQLEQARRGEQVLENELVAEKERCRFKMVQRQRECTEIQDQCASLQIEVEMLGQEVNKAERASQNLRGKLHKANEEIATAWARVRLLMAGSGETKELKEKVRAAERNEALRKLAAQMKRLELGGDLGKHYLEVEHFAILSGLDEEEKKTLVLYTLGPQVLKQIPVELRMAGSDFSLLRKSIAKALWAGREDPFWAQLEVKQGANEPTVLYAVKLWLHYCLTQGAEAISGAGRWLSPKLSQLQDALAVFDPAGGGNAEAKVWQAITLHFEAGWDRPQGRSRQRRRRSRRKRCYYCGDPGHLIRDCEEHRWNQPAALPWH